MDDYGNALHWTDVAHGWSSLGLYGYANEWAGCQGLMDSIDFSDVL